ncbi:MAG: 4Fe-4S binding protein [Candidatus Thorarchaeota archaeon]
MPISKDYREHWSIIDQHNGHDVWAHDDSSDVIHGTVVGIHLASCTGCMKCITACPTRVIVPLEQGLVDPLREEDCILCLACELVCPTDAIHIQRSGGSKDTLDSLLG